MRAVIDTNIIVSALLAPAGKPAAIIKNVLYEKL
jgi:predicted nucleic acid-binding protein